MKKVESAGDMAKQLNKHIQVRHIDHFYAEKADAIATLIQGTHGREKMCAVLQYAFEIYYSCMISSEQEWNHTHWSVNLAFNVSRNVSSSRKMLKFLQFMESLKKSYLFQVDQKNKSLTYKVIEQTRIISSFFLYLADNIVWLSNIGLISANVVEGYGYRLPWLVIKDLFAFIKNVSGLIKAIITLIRRQRKLNQLNDQIKQLSDQD